MIGVARSERKAPEVGGKEEDNASIATVVLIFIDLREWVIRDLWNRSMAGTIFSQVEFFTE